MSVTYDRNYGNMIYDLILKLMLPSPNSFTFRMLKILERNFQLSKLLVNTNDRFLYEEKSIHFGLELIYINFLCHSLKL